MTQAERLLERVVVVGAGISGLTVASALDHAGVECVVLEARDRIGGRLHTVDLLGMPVDVGGSWIHHPTGNPLTTFADAMDLPRKDGDVLSTIGGFDLHTGRRLSPTEISSLLDVQQEQFAESLDPLRARLPEGATAAEAIDSFVAAGEPLDHDRARIVRQALRAMVEADAADRAENQSLRWMWTEVEYDDDIFGDLPVGGYRSVIDALADGLDIRPRSEVVGIEVADDGVRVSTADGVVEQASHVVVTVPLGVLKAETITFTPPLSPGRVDAIHALGFGRYEKIILRFESAFWRDAGVTHLMVFHSDADQPATWIIDLDAFGDGPGLAVHVFHSATGWVHDSTSHETIAWARGMIGAATGSPCPEPVATIVTGWASDPYTRGAYTHVPPRAHPGMLDLLGEADDPRLLFAGEHTQSARTGYADGAFSSGVRAARQLLGSSDVVVGRM